MSDVKRYSNLAAVLDGRVSGKSTEWPLVRAELGELYADYANLTARIASLEREKEEARDKALEEAWRLERTLQESADQTGLYNLALSDYAGSIHSLRAMKGTKP